MRIIEKCNTYKVHQLMKVNIPLNLIIFTVLVMLFQNQVCKGITLAAGGKTNYQIIIPLKATSNEKQAAQILSKYLEQITGASFAVHADNARKTDYEILIGINSHLNAPLPTIVNHADGYSIETRRNNLLINGGGGKGVLYAVYTFLEKFCKCRKYDAGPAFVPKQNELIIPDEINISEVPDFDFREYYYTAIIDEEYLDWHKLMQHFKDTVHTQWGMWVHTFDKLVPASKYFDTHPEYYSYYGGKRQPAQLCLSNPDVYTTLVNNLRTEMKLKPGAKYWSVSQNDNYGYCQCNRCSMIDSAEGSASGSVIRFVNKVANEFPDKVISTLAYQYTRSAPKITKPAKNVNIMFCSIECNRSMPIAIDSTSASFRKDLEAWGKLTHNILVWDYVVQFSNYVSPFPNLHVLQPNLQYFKSQGVNDMFEQGSSSNWSDFGELKAYLLAACMWNVNINADSVIADFVNGYYGAAGPEILNYFYTITSDMQQANQWLDIYGNPITPHDTWLTTDNLANYNELMQEAMSQVEGNEILMDRLRKLWLPLTYAKLEQAKFYGSGEHGIFERTDNGQWIAKPGIRMEVELFVQQLKESDIVTLNENHLSPDEYLAGWHHIFDHGMMVHLAMDKQVTFQIPFSPKYPAKGANTLTDGVGGYDDYHYNWLGWEGEDMTALVDLGEVKDISIMSCNFLEDQKSWIFFPSSVEFYFATDGKNYQEFGTATNEAPVAEKNARIKTYSIAKKSFSSARYLKVVAHNLKTCPPWHIGAGYRCWIFCDEIVAK